MTNSDSDLRERVDVERARERIKRTFRARGVGVEGLLARSNAGIVGSN